MKLFDMEKEEFEKLVDICVKKKLEMTITVSPENVEICMHPYYPSVQDSSFTTTPVDIRDTESWDAE